MSNLKQNGLACKLYADDYNEEYPRGRRNYPNMMTWGSTSGSLQGTPMSTTMGDYGMVRGTVRCPSVSTLNRSGNDSFPDGAVPSNLNHWPSDPATANGFGLMTYIYFGGASTTDPHNYPMGNYWYGWHTGFPFMTKFTAAGADRVRPCVRERFIDYPSLGPLMFDISYSLFSTFTNGGYPAESNHEGGDGFTGAGINMIYVDGHASWVKLDAGTSDDSFGEDAGDNKWYR